MSDSEIVSWNERSPLEKLTLLKSGLGFQYDDATLEELAEAYEQEVRESQAWAALDLLNAKDFAQLVNKPTQRIYDCIKDGKLTAVKRVGRKGWLIPKSETRRFEKVP